MKLIFTKEILLQIKDIVYARETASGVSLFGEKGGRGLWEFNRFGAGNHCKEWSYAKRLVIDARQCTAPSFHPGDGTPRRFFFQAQIHLPYTRGSVRRASGFVVCWACST